LLRHIIVERVDHVYAQLLDLVDPVEDVFQGFATSEAEKIDVSVSDGIPSLAEILKRERKSRDGEGPGLGSQRSPRVF